MLIKLSKNNTAWSIAFKIHCLLRLLWIVQQRQWLHELRRNIKGFTTGDIARWNRFASLWAFWLLPHQCFLQQLFQAKGEQLLRRRFWCLRLGVLISMYSPLCIGMNSLRSYLSGCMCLSQRILLIVVIYQCCAQPTNLTGNSAFSQQEILLSQMDRPTINPRANFYQDICKLIQKFQTNKNPHCRQ